MSPAVGPIDKIINLPLITAPSSGRNYAGSSDATLSPHGFDMPNTVWENP